MICSYFSKLSLHCRWEYFWNGWRYLYVCQNISIWKDISNIFMSRSSCLHHKRKGHCLHLRMRGHCSVYVLLSWTIWEDGSWLAAEWWVPSQCQGHKLDGDAFFIKAPKFGAQKYYKIMKVSVYNKQASFPLHYSHKRRKASCPLLGHLAKIFALYRWKLLSSSL